MRLLQKEILGRSYIDRDRVKDLEIYALIYLFAKRYLYSCVKCYLIGTCLYHNIHNDLR